MNSVCYLLRILSVILNLKCDIMWRTAIDYIHNVYVIHVVRIIHIVHNVYIVRIIHNVHIDVYNC